MNKENLLKEELKRHMQLLEYTFYMPEVEDEEYGERENLLLGDKKLYEQDPVAGEETDDTFAPGDTGDVEDPFAGVDMGVEEPAAPEGEEPAAPEGEEDPFGEEDVEVEDEFADETAGGDETVEVDVTDIVDKAEETRNEIEGLTSKMEELMGNFGELSTQVSGMDQVINKIEGLEKEIEKRNPTPVEKLEMMSLDSFPYSVKLTDYWADKEGYETGSEEEEDYTITQKDVDDYSSSEIKDSFDYNENDEDENYDKY
tara:strand:+ start:1788 stop:2558 length:771 start_codon:yes stop_codon:yes gene_type:complete